MDLLDALSSNSQARSVVELSLEACFQREHTSVFKAIAAYRPEWMNKSLAQLAAVSLPDPQQRSFWLLGVDTTPQPRLYAQTLKDRGYVYQPAAIQSNKPVTIGHCYSEVVLLPEREVQQGKPWVVPLSSQRVSSTDDKELDGAIQINVLLDDPQLPFHDQLCVEVGDTSYRQTEVSLRQPPKIQPGDHCTCAQNPYFLPQSSCFGPMRFPGTSGLVWTGFLPSRPFDLAGAR